MKLYVKSLYFHSVRNDVTGFADDARKAQYPSVTNAIHNGNRQAGKTTPDSG
jgi:hypothetical protein